MKISRRQIMSAAMAAVAVSVVPGVVAAQVAPSAPIGVEVLRQEDGFSFSGPITTAFSKGHHPARDFASAVLDEIYAYLEVPDVFPDYMVGGDGSLVDDERGIAWLMPKVRYTYAVIKNLTDDEDSDWILRRDVSPHAPRAFPVTLVEV